MPAMPSARSCSSDIDVRELYAVRQIVDEIIERGLVEHWGVGEMLSVLLPRVSEVLNADGVFVETYGEDLELHCYSFEVDDKPAEGAIALARERVFEGTAEGRRERVQIVVGRKLVVAQPLDVAGTWFGRAGVMSASDTDPRTLAAGLEAVCEVLDNYLFSVSAMRRRHDILMDLGTALRHRVLADGLREAVAVLVRSVPIDRILLVYVPEESATKSLHVQLFERGELRVDTLSARDEAHASLRRLGLRYLHGESTELLTQLGIEGAQEEVLINGITKSVVVGKIVVTSERGPFNTWDRELLSAFAGFIRQRVVDFNKEWRALASAFRHDDVARLLSSEDYERTWLSPREEIVGILYVDIAGFTRISERILKHPSSVAELVEHWSREAVDIVWRHGGVFDKMVGDCIIALFGPPFYDAPPGERLASAIRCAHDVRAMTSHLPERTMFESLRAGGLSVATGVNLAPLFVGQFGPNNNFTGFSSGMNNTARLQGCASKDEILVMEDAISQLPSGHTFSFGEVRSAPVKNVAEPLRFRALVG